MPPSYGIFLWLFPSLEKGDASGLFCPYLLIFSYSLWVLFIMWFFLPQRQFFFGFCAARRCLQTEKFLSGNILSNIITVQGKPLYKFCVIMGKPKKKPSFEGFFLFYPIMSFIFFLIFEDSFASCLSKRLSRACRSSFCSSVRLAGVSTITSMSRSPVRFSPG